MSAPLAPLARRMAALLPEGVSVAADDPRAGCHGLLPQERAQIATARAPRRAEFAAGRRAARQAMTGLGHPPTALLRGPDRAPLWPARLAGSIAHDATACLAAVTDRPLHLGIDLEPARPLPRDLWPEVCAAETAWLDTLPAETAGLMARAVFSVKESFFKAQFPVTGAWLDFDAVSVTPGSDGGLRVIPCVAPETVPSATIRAGFRIDTDHILTAVTLKSG